MTDTGDKAVTDTPKPQPEPLICRMYDALLATAMVCDIYGHHITCNDAVEVIAAARPLVEAIRSGEMVPVEVWVGVTDDKAYLHPAVTSINRETVDGYHRTVTRATVYAHKPRPVEVSEGYAEPAT